MNKYVRVLKQDIIDGVVPKTMKAIGILEDLNIDENRSICDYVMSTEIGDYIYIRTKIFDTLVEINSVKSKGRENPPSAKENKVIQDFIDKYELETITIEQFNDLQTRQFNGFLDIRESNKLSESKTIESISHINIKKLYSIKSLELDNLKDKKEIYIVGENGDGKTLLLQGIILGIKGVETGEIFDFTKKLKEYNIKIKDHNQNLFDYKNSIDFKTASNIFAYGVSRNQTCDKKEDELGYLTLFNSCIDLYNPIKWLQQLDYSEKSNEKNIVSLSTAIGMLQNLLNENVEIKVDPKGVKFIERESEVSFEHLSAGYKGIINIITDLLARLAKSQPEIKDIKNFIGVVLIDEVELHLHPKWKYNFISKLRSYFPKIQFILTTHSPTVLLGASEEAVFYKIYKENGEVKISNQIKNKGFTANTITSSPIFGLENITSKNYKGVFSSDDYIYENIHKVVNERIKNLPDISEDELLRIINEEFDKEEL